jgi:hypothetical protein
MTRVIDRLDQIVSINFFGELIVRLVDTKRSAQSLVTRPTMDGRLGYS